MKSYHPSIVFSLTVLCIFALPQIGIDLYLPALPSITTSLQSSIASGQASMSIYIFSMGGTQLFYGPLSDVYGRKPVVLSGIVIFFCGSVIASIAPSMAVFLLGRAIQGIGMGSGFTVASAILADEFKGAELARMGSYSSMVYSSSPLLAPVLGGYIVHYFYWQVNFYVMAVLSLLLFLAIYGFVKSSYQPPASVSLSINRLCKVYLHVISNGRFLAYAAMTMLAFGLTIVFNVVGPFLLQEALHVSQSDYGWLLFILGMAYLLGTYLNTVLLKYLSPTTLLLLGNGLVFLGSIGFFSTSIVGVFTVMSVICWTSGIVFSSGFIWPNAFACAIESFSENLGQVSALIAAMGLVGTAGISLLVSLCHVYSEVLLATVFLSMAVLQLLLMMGVRR